MHTEPARHLPVRVPTELRARVEAYRRRLEADVGASVPRAIAVRGLLSRGLDAVERDREAAA